MRATILDTHGRKITHEKVDYLKFTGFYGESELYFFMICQVLKYEKQKMSM